jgi:ribosomal-protein-alanine N-acetyltransferase
MMVERLWLAPAGLHIEPARVDDAEVLARLHAASFYRGWSREEFATFLANPADMPALVVCDGQRRVFGFILFRIAADEAELLTVAVDERRRGKGLGLALLDAGLADLRTTRVNTVYLEVDRDNPAALAIYRRRGFQVVGERKGYYARPDGGTASALVMMRQLG